MNRRRHPRCHWHLYDRCEAQTVNSRSRHHRQQPLHFGRSACQQNRKAEAAEAFRFLEAAKSLNRKTLQRRASGKGRYKPLRLEPTARPSFASGAIAVPGSDLAYCTRRLGIAEVRNGQAKFRHTWRVSLRSFRHGRLIVLWQFLPRVQPFAPRVLGGMPFWSPCCAQLMTS